MSFVVSEEGAAVQGVGAKIDGAGLPEFVVEGAVIARINAEGKLAIATLTEAEKATLSSQGITLVSQKIAVV